MTASVQPAARIRPRGAPGVVDAPGPGALRGWLDRVLTDLDAREIAAVVVPAPLVDGLPLVGGGDSAHYAPVRGPAVSCRGEAATIAIANGGSARDLIEPLAALRRRVSVIRHPAVPPELSPPLIGGLAFDSGRPDMLGPGRFVLGEVTYVRHDDAAFLIVALPAGDGVWAADVEARIDAALGRLRAGIDPRPPPPLTGRVEQPFDRWERGVVDALDRFRLGTLEKVVLARTAELSFDRPLDARSIVATLRARHPACAVFAIARGDAAFVGATPEQLLRTSGGRLSTEALAGTRPAGPGAITELVASEKDRREHDLVVRDIAARLGPLCSVVHVGATTPRTLRGLVHLSTPIDAALASGRVPLEAVADLHPTPAVGGAPREAALAFIAHHEERSRGWYAGPIGVVRLDGDVDLSVALRSGLLRGASATTFAGAGLVLGSDPIAEHGETEAKLRAIGAALAPGERAR